MVGIFAFEKDAIFASHSSAFFYVLRRSMTRGSMISECAKFHVDLCWLRCVLALGRETRESFSGVYTSRCPLLLLTRHFYTLFRGV